METKTATRSEVERRGPTDRRRRPTSPWDALLGGRNRGRLRRSTDRRAHVFFDRHSTGVLLMVLLLLGMTIADGLITLDLIENECEEVNPVMRWLLDQGHVPFLAGKYVLTASGLPFLVAFENRPLFRTRFRTGYVLPIFVTLYMLLLYYQVGMLREREYLRGLQALATAPPNPSVGPPTRTE